ncbi:phage major tail protein, TP901-1 family [Rossellomorea marisflavi]|jgi:TP901-1 family phage major tail protein|uniref:phage major tail protein, TP901-1 family n=1 Tax=Rossellomorea marisflavi TaxID=189381 RepID=UPI00345CD0B8
MRQLGKNTLLMVQPEDNTIGEQGLLIAELTENSYSIENDIIDEKTKMGRIVDYGENSESFELSAYATRGDAGQQAILKAIKNKKMLKVWEFDRVPNENGAYNAVFAKCIVESAEVSHGDSFSELSATLQVTGESVEGELTELPAMATQAPYEFEAPGETGETA